MAGQCKARFYVHHTAADVGGRPTPSGLGRSVVVNRKGTMKKRKLYEMVGRLTARVAEQEAEIVRLIADAAAETDVDEPPTDDDHHQLIHQVRTLLGFNVGEFVQHERLAGLLKEANFIKQPDEPLRGVCVGAISTRLCRVCTLNKTCPARDAWLYRESHAERFPAVDPSGTLDTPTPTE